jgi:hypothetical protein
MKKLSVILFAAIGTLSLITLSSCMFNCKRGSGKLITENREVSGFSRLDISGSYKVVIKQDSTESLTITADDNLMKYVKTDVIGDRLKIYSSRNLCTSGQYTVYVTIKDLSYIKTSGATNVSSDGKLTVKDIELNTSGATKITLNLNADDVNTRASGLTELVLEGQAKSHTLKTSGSGTLNAFNFVVNSYRIESSGLSHCKINVLNNLSINSSGASDIQYRGNPANIENNRSGIASLKQVN